jgi:DNA-binding transcriptional LysR family regulator
MTSTRKESTQRAVDTNVQLDDLDVFVRVIEGRSMSAAARVLGVPKSTVSRAISRLEDAFACA